VIPSGRLAALALIATLFGGVAAFQDGWVGALLGFDAAWVGLALIDLGRNRGSVSVRRRHVPVVAVGRTSEVEVEVSNLGARTLDLLVNDDVAGVRGGLPARCVVGVGEQAIVRYQLTLSTRGRYLFGAVTVRWRSPWGLWARQVEIPTPSEIKVFPDFTFLRAGMDRGRDAERNAPVRVRRAPGGESEFQRLRQYVPGDAYRHIDWKATARRQRPITREYGQESNQNVIFLLDAGRMMSARVGDLSLFDHALNASLAMGHAALRHGDRVGLLGFDREVRAWLPPRGGVTSGQRMLHATFDLFPSLSEPDFAAAFRHLSASVRQRSLVVLLTTIVDQVSADNATAVARALGTRHLPLCVWLRDVDLDALIDAPPGDEASLLARGAAAELVAWREQSLSALRRRGVLVVDCAPDELSAALLARYLEIKARRLL
jgi:uncharacterized protein (DUF58 family)